MIREIKFRAWNNPSKEMLYSDDFTLSEFFHEIYPLDKNSGLMQYTGLTDKNGIEIYEGDYVRTITSKTKKLRGGIVVWHGGGFCINYKDEPNTFEWMIYPEIKYEVIGNIYQ